MSKLIDEAVYLHDKGTKNLAGSITRPEDLVRNARALESLHKGMFAFLAFHPGTDKEVFEYVEKGSLPSDSGPNILVLFFSATEIRMPRIISPKDLGLGINLDLNVHPAYEFTKWLFPVDTMLKLPGLIFFDRVFDVVDAIYLPLSKRSTVSEVAEFCRSAFVLADAVVTQRQRGEPISFDSLSFELKSNGIEYSRTGSASAGEWLLSAYGFAKKHGGTIASVIAKIAKAL
ncbi:MAG: hypothetical protein ACKV2U_04035 [Bryobacteraceae bacterium]